MATKNEVYNERNCLICLLSKIFPSCLGIDNKVESGFKTVVYIQLPTGQVSWHIPDYLLHRFKHLKLSDSVVYDGHTTKEKYERIKAIKSHMVKEVYNCA